MLVIVSLLRQNQEHHLRYKNKYQPEDVAQWREFAYKTAIEMNRDLRTNTWFDENLEGGEGAMYILFMQSYITKD